MDEAFVDDLNNMSVRELARVNMNDLEAYEVKLLARELQLRLLDIEANWT